MKNLNKIFQFLGLTVASYSAFKIIQLYRENKSGFSSFSGESTKKIVFTLTNNTDSIQTEYLFDSRGGADNSNVGVSGNLKRFNRELATNPKMVEKFEFRDINSNFSGVSGDELLTKKVVVGTKDPQPTTPAVPIEPKPTIPATPVEPKPTTPAEPISEPKALEVAPAPVEEVKPKYEQSTAPFVIICKDANGNESSKQYIPMVTTTQFQKGITSVNMDDLILDGECYMKYTMYPKSKVAIVVYYKDKSIKKIFKK